MRHSGFDGQRKDMIVSLPTNVSLTAPLDHSIGTSSHGSHKHSHKHSTGGKIITAFRPQQQLRNT